MPTTLQTLLASNQEVLGYKFKNLGKSHGILLSFDATKGWAIAKFNGIFGCFKWILRYFEFYKSTHLSTITVQLQKEGVVARTLIEYCWMKRPGIYSRPLGVISRPIDSPQVNARQAQVNSPQEGGAIRIDGAPLAFARSYTTQVADAKVTFRVENEIKRVYNSFSAWTSGPTRMFEASRLR